MVGDGSCSQAGHDPSVLATSVPCPAHPAASALVMQRLDTPDMAKGHRNIDDRVIGQGIGRRAQRFQGRLELAHLCVSALPHAAACQACLARLLVDCLHLATNVLRIWQPSGFVRLDVWQADAVDPRDRKADRVGHIQ